MAEKAGEDYSVVPHPTGGFTVVPSSLLTDAQREHFAGIQRAGQLPSPTSEMPGRMQAPAGRTAEPVTYDEHGRTLGMRNALDDFRRESDTPTPRGAAPTGQVPPSAPPQMPLTAKAAQSRADSLTAKTGVEHEVVPHPFARDKFAVRPIALEGSYTRVPDQETPNAGRKKSRRSKRSGRSNPQMAKQREQDRKSAGKKPRQYSEQTLAVAERSRK
jgi:hypothetical protein